MANGLCMAMLTAVFAAVMVFSALVFVSQRRRKEDRISSARGAPRRSRLRGGATGTTQTRRSLRLEVAPVSNHLAYPMLTAASSTPSKCRLNPRRHCELFRVRPSSFSVIFQTIGSGLIGFAVAG
jgi:hypothetical protein